MVTLDLLLLHSQPLPKDHSAFEQTAPGAELFAVGVLGCLYQVAGEGPAVTLGSVVLSDAFAETGVEFAEIPEDYWLVWTVMMAVTVVAL